MIEVAIDITPARQPPAASLPPIVETAWLYEEGFAGVADNTRLAAGGAAEAGSPGDLGWDAISSTGSTSLIRFNPWAIGERISVDTAATGGESTAGGTHLVAPTVDVGSSDMIVEAVFREYNSTNTAFELCGSNEINRLSVKMHASGVTLHKYLASTSPASMNGPASGTGKRFMGGLTGEYKTPALGDRLTARKSGTRLRIYKNGLRLGPANGYDATGVGGTRFGIATHNQGYRGIDDLKAAPLPASIQLDPLAARAYPRKFANVLDTVGYADVPISGSYTGAVTGLQWALIDPVQGTLAPLVKGWARITSLTIGAGTFSATLRVPWGLNGVGGYCLAVRAEDNTHAYDALAAPFYVVANILIAGQSNASAFRDPISALADHDGGLYYFENNTGNTTVAATWQWTSQWPLTGTSDVNAGAITRLLSARLGGPVGCTIVAVGSAPASTLGPGGSNWAWISAHIALSGGAFELIYWNQGEAEGGGTGSTTQANGWTATVVANIDGPGGYRSLSGQPAGRTVPVFVAITGRNTTVLSEPSLSNSNANFTELRRQQRLIESAGEDYHIAHHAAGLTMFDELHFTDDPAGQGKMGERAALSMGKVMAGGLHDGRGPIATGATRAGAVVTVAVDLNGASDLAGGETTGLTSWVVSANADLSSPLAQASAEVSGGAVVITLGADPGGPVYVANYQGRNPSEAAWPAGTYATADYTGTIEMEPVAAALLTASEGRFDGAASGG